MCSKGGSPSDQRGPSSDRHLNEFRELLRQARAGSAEAAQRLYDGYRQHVLHIVRRHLSQPLRRICDSVDLTQDVWKSVFTRVQAGQDFACPAQFLQFLNAVARNKTLLRQRHEVRARKRSLSREEPFDRHAHEVRARPDPHEGPSERVTAEDDWAQLIRSLSERDRPIVEMLRAGASLETVAQELHVSVKTLRRFAERCRQVRSRQDDPARRSHEEAP